MKTIVINTACGAVEGTVSKEPDVVVYRGIRYAVANRWEYPEKVTHWDGVYDATVFGACSYQPRAFYNEAEMPEKAFYYNEFRKGESYTYSEDCLFLNIWAPMHAQNLPVLFFIHGGEFKGGCGHEKQFSGEEYCKRGVILVTCNYRLGPLGFCCLPELYQEAGHTGNYGLYDQLCALQWVQDNITAFGGDANRITLMGQSAGAISVQQLCTSPLTEGLFAGAIMLSGGGVNKLMSALPAQKAYPFWQEMAKHLGATDLYALRAVAPEKLYDAFNTTCTEYKRAMAFCGPVLDGILQPITAANAAIMGCQHPVPYLMGSTSEDIAPPIIFKMAKSWARLQSDQKKSPSYAYFFCRRLPGDDKGAWHSADLWYAFGTLSKCWRPFTKYDYEISDAMISYFVNFAKTGNPNTVGLPQWDPMEKGQNFVMRFGDNSIHMGGVSFAKLTRTTLQDSAAKN